MRKIARFLIVTITRAIESEWYHSALASKRAYIIHETGTTHAETTSYVLIPRGKKCTDS